MTTTRDHATTNNPDGRGRGAGALWAPHRGEPPPPPPNPQMGKTVLSFFYGVLCIFYLWGGTHKIGKPFCREARGRGGRN